MSSGSSIENQNIDEKDAIDLYFAFVTACSLDDDGIECTTRCIEVL